MDVMKSKAAAGFGTVSKIDVSAINASSFNEPIQGKYLGLGQHKVKIVSLEVTSSQYGESIKAVFEDESGATANTYVPIKFQPKDATKAPMYSNDYRLFTRLAISDAEQALRMKFFTEMVPANPALLDGLRGMELTITVSAPTKGTNIAPNSGGTYNIVDVATGQPSVAAPGAFMSLDEAAKTQEALGLKRAFNKVTAMTATPEEVASNEKTLRTYLTNLESPATVQKLHSYGAF